MLFNCHICSAAFQSSHKAKFCGQKCYGLSKRGRASWNSGIKTNLAPWRGKRRSEETIAKIKATKAINKYSHPADVRIAISKKLIGISKGGVSKTAVLIRGTTKYKQWRAAVFKRDNYSCQECGVRGAHLNADHKITFVTLLKRHAISDIAAAAQCEALWDVSNGVTLCLECHRRTPTFGNRRAA